MRFLFALIDIIREVGLFIGFYDLEQSFFKENYIIVSGGDPISV